MSADTTQANPAAQGSAQPPAPTGATDPVGTASEGTEPLRTPENGAEPTGPTFDAAYVAQLRQENAGHRHRARDAEAARDRLAARLERTDRAAVEATAAAMMHSPEDLWLAGVELDRLRTADGELDDAKVKAELERVIAEHPKWGQGVPDFAGGARAPAEPAQGFGAQLKRSITGQR